MSVTSIKRTCEACGSDICDVTLSCDRCDAVVHFTMGHHQGWGLRWSLPDGWQSFHDSEGKQIYFCAQCRVTVKDQSVNSVVAHEA